MQDYHLLYHIYHGSLDNPSVEKNVKMTHKFKTIINDMDRSWVWVKQLQDNINKIETQSSDKLTDEEREQITREVREFERGLSKNKKVASNKDSVLKKASDLANMIKSSPQEVTDQIKLLEKTLQAYYSSDSRNNLDAEITQADVRVIINTLRGPTNKSRAEYRELFVALRGIIKDITSYGDLPKLQKSPLPLKEKEKIEYLLDCWKYSKKNKALHSALTDFYSRASDDESLKKLVSAVTEATFATYSTESTDEERLSKLESLNALTPKSLGQKIADALKIIFMTLLATTITLLYLTYFSIPIILSATIIAQSAAAGAVLGGIMVYFGIFAFNPEKLRRGAIEISNIIQKSEKGESSDSLRDARDDYVGEYPLGISDIINDCKNFENEEYKKLIMNPTMGCIMTGPPGCGKTMLAEIIALEVGCPFVQVSMNDILSHMIYEPVANIHKVYADALEQAQKHPSKLAVLFFDEVENILPKRGGGRNKASDEHTNAMTGALLELIQDKSNDGARVIFVGATNRPELIDSAAIDRLGLINIPLPTIEKRQQVLKRHLGKMSCDLSDRDVLDGITCVATMTENCSARTLVDLIKKAGRIAYNEHSDRIEGSHLMSVAVAYDEEVKATDKYAKSGF